MLVAMTVPLVVALISVSRVTWFPTGDMAQAELHVSGFFSHPPLIGAAGRIGSTLEPYGQGSHPGPALWFALLPSYLITGRSSFGLELGMTLIQLAFIVATVVVVRRLIGGIGALVTATIATVLVYSMGPAPFIEPWNPWGALFAFFCFIALCWGIVCGRHRWLPAAAFCGFFAVQCHAGYALLVGAALAAMVVVFALRWRREHPPGILRSWWIAVAVTIAMWTPPVIDQLRRSPGNLRILWHHFTASAEADGSPRPFVGMRAALKAFAGELSLPGPWIRGDFRQPTATPNLIGLVVAVVFIAITVALLVRRRGDSQRDVFARLFILLGGLTAVGVFSTSRVFGEFYDYVIRWWWLIVAWVFIACILVLIRRLRTDVVIGAALVIALGFCSLATANAVGEQNPGPRNSRITGGIDAVIAPALSHSDRYLLRWDDPSTLGGVPFGMLLDLEKHGFHVGVDAASAAGSLPHRVLPEASANAVLWIVLGEVNIDRFRQRADATELGSYDQRSTAEIAEATQLRTRLTDRLEQLDLSCLVPKIDQQYGLAAFYLRIVAVPDDVAQTASDLNALGLPVAVFSVPPFAAPFDDPAPGC